MDRQDSSIEALIKMICVGSEEEADAAFEALEKRFRHLVLYIVSKVLTNSEDIRDAMQITFMKLAKDIRELNPVTVEKWVMDVAEHAAIDILRPMLRHGTLLSLDDVPVELEPAFLVTPYEELTYSEMQRRIDALPEKLSVVVRLFEAGRSAKDIAAMFGLTDKAVYARLAKAASLLGVSRRKSLKKKQV